MECEDNWKPELGPVCGPFLYSQYSKLKITDNAWLALCGLSSPPSTNTREPWPFNGAKAPFEAYTGSKKSYHRNQTRNFGARHTVEYDSVLSQQCIHKFDIVCMEAGFFQIQS